MTPFNERLKEVRKGRKKKQREAADLLGIHVRTYQYYEGGSIEPDIAALIRLADYFDVSLDILMGRYDWDEKTEEAERTN